jgi:hypothetical protein
LVVVKAHGHCCLEALAEQIKSWVLPKRNLYWPQPMRIGMDWQPHRMGKRESYPFGAECSNSTKSARTVVGVSSDVMRTMNSSNAFIRPTSIKVTGLMVDRIFVFSKIVHHKRTIATVGATDGSHFVVHRPVTFNSLIFTPIPSSLSSLSRRQNIHCN